MRQRILKNGSYLGIVFVLCAGFLQNSVRQVSLEPLQEVSSAATYFALSINPKIINRLLGLRILVADLIWVDTLIKSDLKHEEKDFTTFYQSFQTLLKLDPDNLYAGYFAGMYLSVVKDDIKGASAVLRTAAARISEKNYSNNNVMNVYFTLGYNLIFEEQEIEEGSLWIKKAAELPTATNLIKHLALMVDTERGRLDVASRILSNLYKRVKKPEEKAKIEAKMLVIASKQELVDLNQQFQEYLSSTGAYAFPKKRQLQMFFRSIGHRGKTLTGQTLELGASGKVQPVGN